MFVMETNRFEGGRQLGRLRIVSREDDNWDVYELPIVCRGRTTVGMSTNFFCCNLLVFLRRLRGSSYYSLWIFRKTGYYCYNGVLLQKKFAGDCAMRTRVKTSAKFAVFSRVSGKSPHDNRREEVEDCNEHRGRGQRGFLRCRGRSTARGVELRLLRVRGSQGCHGSLSFWGPVVCLSQDIGANQGWNGVMRTNATNRPTAAHLYCLATRTSPFGDVVFASTRRSHGAPSHSRIWGG